MRDPRLALYKRLLLAWTEKVNLIGPEARAHLDQHIDEALAAAEILQPHGDVLDFGSGGGLPAIPMAIAAPHARFHLVEADQKKWAFLKHVVRECGLNALIYGDRLHRVLPQLPRNIQCVISRAVGSPEDWLPSLAPYLADGGVAALFQGSPDMPLIAGFRPRDVFPLPRGQSNYLVTLTFHVEQP